MIGKDLAPPNLNGNPTALATAPPLRKEGPGPSPSIRLSLTWGKGLEPQNTPGPSPLCPQSPQL